MKNKCSFLLPLVFVIYGIGNTKAQQSYITIPDTRNNVTIANDYNQQLKADFKYASVVDLPIPDYVTVLGLRGWVDNSGGPAHQLAFHSDKLFWRTGYDWGWRGWKELVLADQNGNVGIGTATPNEKLAVNGNIRAKEIKVEATNWPDYVFKKDYQLMSLKEVEQHIQQHGHLPDVPKASQIEADGLSVSEMNKLMMKKIEELTLHLIEKDKKVQELEQRLQAVEKSKP